MRTERFTRERCAALGAEGVAEAVRKLVPGVESVQGQVREIIADVRDRGDAAVLELTARLDLSGEEARPLRVSQEELDEAITQLSHELVAGLQVAILNVSDVAAAGVHADRKLQLSQGHSIALRELPVDSAAVYVPGGRAPYPSTAVMGVVTARAAGVLDVCVCSPPRKDGEIDRVVLGACRLLGVERVYRMGGAQAVAALAHGTETVGRVDVIVGPGNLFVQEAKRQLSDKVGIDGIAGPSDLVLVAAAGANPRLAALDLLAQAEHGQGSLVVLVSPEQELIEAIEREVARQEEAGAAQQQASGAGQAEGTRQAGRTQDAALAIVHATDAAEAVEIADRIAPEHMQLVGAEVEALSRRVRRAGCLFVGPGSGTAFGDYVAGSNHILPTGGAARFSSALGPSCFRRRMAEVRIPMQSAATLAAAGVQIARAEGFALHAESMQARAESLGEAGEASQGEMDEPHASLGGADEPHASQDEMDEARAIEENEQL